MQRFSVMCTATALLLLLSSQTAQADSWRFDVGNKADALQLASSGVGFNDDGSERPGQLQAMFADWCTTYNLASPDDKVAFKNFKNNMKEVRRINLDASIPFWAAGNQFSHLSESDFQALYLGATAPTADRRSALDMEAASTASTTLSAAALRGRKLMGKPAPKTSPSPKPSPSPRPSPSPKPSPSPSPNPGPAPTYTPIDWRALGMVTPIRNQAQCGSCWAFAAVASIESRLLMAGQGTSSTLDLSEQQLVSCVNTANSPYSSGGCSGGGTDSATNYAAWSPLVKESLWPYTATDSACNTALIAPATSGNAVQLAGNVAGVSPSNDAGALRAAVTAAPTPFYFMVDSSFQNYKGGVYTSTTCTTSVNHAMLLVGFNLDSATNTWYWIVKNSWGTGWGEAGYIRVQMSGNGAGLCGMYQYSFITPATFTSAPLS